MSNRTCGINRDEIELDVVTAPSLSFQDASLVDEGNWLEERI
jgi:hypothetical protein